MSDQEARAWLVAQYRTAVELEDALDERLAEASLRFRSIRDQYSAADERSEVWRNALLQTGMSEDDLDAIRNEGAQHGDSPRHE